MQRKITESLSKRFKWNNMPNSFLFIIPLTPRSYLTENRLALRTLCFDTLLAQTYSNWKALVIGEKNLTGFNSERFITIDFEGPKEEKLQMATRYIIDSGLNPDYIIRLDDDDIFNPGILSQLKDFHFDLYVDKFHSYWDVSSGRIAQQIMYWFPNTCIHKASHALTTFGSFPAGDYKRFRPQPVLIENEHNDFHLYYTDKSKIIYSHKRDPLYLRTLNPDSITSSGTHSYSEYLSRHGYWKKNNLSAFNFLKNYKISEPEKQVMVKQNFLFLIKSLKHRFISLWNYKRIVIKK